MTKNAWPLRLAIAAIAIACVGLIAAIIVPLVPIWPCVLFEHFRIQYIAGGVVVVACAAALGMRGYFDAAALTTVLHLLWISPELRRAPRLMPSDGVPVRVLVLNVHTESSTFEQVRQLIEDIHPDVVGLVEVDDRWLRGVAPVVAQFGGRLERPRGDNFGVALYTRAPLAGSIEELGGSLPVAVGSVNIDGASFSIMLIHPLPPVSAAALVAQREELDAVADRAHTLAGPVVIMGDFNATPWSRPYRRFLASSGLCDSRAGFGIQATFPAASVVLRIPIDHLLATCSVGIADRHVERDVGSDHLPIVLDLVIPRS
jgi:endonuclease/exonuclease/phosphatase (EEP) superfamily protein YafD